MPDHGAVRRLLPLLERSLVGETIQAAVRQRSLGGVRLRRLAKWVGWLLTAPKQFPPTTSSSSSSVSTAAAAVWSISLDFFASSTRPRRSQRPGGSISEGRCMNESLYLSLLLLAPQKAAFEADRGGSRQQTAPKFVPYPPYIPRVKQTPSSVLSVHSPDAFLITKDIKS